MIKYKHRGGGNSSSLLTHKQQKKNELINLQLFAYKEVENPYKLNAEAGKEYRAKADISEAGPSIIRTFSVSNLEDVPYNGKEQRLKPSITDDLGTAYDPDKYQTGPYYINIQYSSEGPGTICKDCTGLINVTIQISVVEDDYGIYDPDTDSVVSVLTINRYYTITPLTITINITNVSKYSGQADPALTCSYSGTVNGEVPGWSGYLTRAPGEAVGFYAITIGTLQLADNLPFIASNYVLDRSATGTFTISAAPVVESASTMRSIY